jgi:anthranilate synthase/aminodeoxychorismate synthase-like glutamine amidotransferase
MILLIDNYDSFTYNLYQIICALGQRVRVVRNDQLSVAQVARLRPRALILSPGPGAPREAGICLEAIRTLAGQTPILGVCLGHQAIAEAFGGSVVGARRLMHGKTSAVFHKETGLYAGTRSPLQAMRYHSLIVERRALPETLEVTAHTADHLIMGLRHRELAVEGVQFHPESIATPEGPRLLANFLARAGA